ncbi:MAG: hypothetical protein QW244_01715 [Candidatus Pacearchaeota archaeon]
MRMKKLSNLITATSLAALLGYAPLLAGNGFSNAFEKATHFFINSNSLQYATQNVTQKRSDGEKDLSQFNQFNYLDSNLGGKSKHYYVDASREESEEELKKLMYNEYGVEEAWFYVKGRLHDGKLIERWFECGGDETALLIKKIINPGLVIDYFTSIENFVSYHIHPACEAKEFCTSNFPSMKDLYAALWLKQIITSEAKKRGVSIKSISFSIVTPIGIYDIDAPEINDNNKEEIKSRIISYGAELLLNSPADNEKNLDNLLRKLSWIELRKH